MNDPSGGDGHDQDRELPTAAEVVGHWNDPNRMKTTVYGAHHLEKGDELVRLEDAEQEIAEAVKTSYSNGKRIGRDEMRQKVLDLIDQQIKELGEREKKAEPNFDNILAWRRTELEELREEVEQE